MKNLEQIRAHNAFTEGEGQSVSGKQDGEVIKKIPPIIQNHGFLSAAAYACDENNKGWRQAFDAIARHLATPGIDLVPKEVKDTNTLIKHLTAKDADSGDLKLVTAEALAWLNYARRFIKKKDDRNKGGDKR